MSAWVFEVGIHLSSENFSRDFGKEATSIVRLLATWWSASSATSTLPVTRLGRAGDVLHVRSPALQGSCFGTPPTGEAEPGSEVVKLKKHEELRQMEQPDKRVLQAFELCTLKRHT